MKKQDSNIPWWLIALSFIFCWPVGIVFLLSYLSKGFVDKPNSSGRTGQHQDFRTFSATTYTGTSATPPTHRSSPTDPPYKKSNLLSDLRVSIKKKLMGGKLLTGVGGAAALLFALMFANEIGTYGFDWPEDWLPSLVLAFTGLATMGFGILKTRFGRRQQLYLGAIGNRKSVFLSDLAAAAGVSEQRVLTDVQKMFAEGALPMGYIDRASGRLVFSEDGYESQNRTTTGETVARMVQEATQEDKDRATLKQIRAINDAIPSDEMSRKIDRIEEITGKILLYARSHPTKTGELRQFLNYYLPTTLKILNAYAQMDAQGVKGSNITSTKMRVELMMDKVVDGFEKQLDQLFQAEAIDITSDVEVLERMLAKDGLGGDSTLTLYPSGNVSSKTGAADAAQTQQTPE